MSYPPLLYRAYCPNCDGAIESTRLLMGGVCRSCLEELPSTSDISSLCALPISSPSPKIKAHCEALKKADDFAEFFEKHTKGSLWGIQRTWAKRFFGGRSFTLLAPTGVGKTTFGVLLAVFLALEEQKSYIIVPTKALVEEIYKKVRGILSQIDKEVEVLAYSDTLFSRKELLDFKTKILKSEATITITTSNFVYRNIDKFKTIDYAFIFVDDVDSVVRSGKRIDAILRLVGFSYSHIRLANRIVRLRREALSARNIDRVEYYTKRVKTLEKRLRDELKNQKIARLLISSATAKPQSSRIKLFRELLDFEVGQITTSLRNIVDVYEPTSSKTQKDLFVRAVETVKQLGSGGLVFLAEEYGKEGLARLLDILKKHGVSADSYQNFTEAVERFRRGDLDVLVGFSSYRNPLARGIDMPERVRYVVFVGVPRLRMRLNYRADLRHLYVAVVNLFPFLEEHLSDDKKRELDTLISKLRKLVLTRKTEKINSSVFFPLVEIIDRFLEEEKLIQTVNERSDVKLQVENDVLWLITADVTGYLQASGRCSRLYLGGLTYGLAYTLIDDPKAFEVLKKRLRWMHEIELKSINEVNISEVLAKVDRDRLRVKEALEGKLVRKQFDLQTTLVVVESPNKARTIANFFGRPAKRLIGGILAYEVMSPSGLLIISASGGHVVDLVKDEGIYGIQVTEEEFVPIFEPINEPKKGVIEALRILASEVDQVIIATDPDTEGEKIAFDIYSLLYPYNHNIKRAEFHEVTVNAFLKALSDLRTIDEGLVKAQLLRRIADRWIGFSISQVLQKEFESPTLSAGRVQSPVLDWIVQRSIQAREKVWEVVCSTEVGVTFRFTSQSPLTDKPHSTEVLLKQIGSEEKELKVVPFTTDTLLRESANVLGFSPSKTMQLAQDLFEMGLITYHRTDSTRVSDVGLRVAQEYIKRTFGEGYFKPRAVGSAYGAHEAIRPTRPLNAQELEKNITLGLSNLKLSFEHLKLYDLIFRRFIASFMPYAKVRFVTFKVRFDGFVTEEIFPVKILREGNNKVIPLKVYPQLLTKQKIKVTNVKIRKRPKVYPYTFAQVVELMKQRKIGRPSTYAITIQKLIDRHYVKPYSTLLYSTPLGYRVIEFLRNNKKLWRFLNEKYTATLEAQMDAVHLTPDKYETFVSKLYSDLFTNL